MGKTFTRVQRGDTVEFIAGVTSDARFKTYMGIGARARVCKVTADRKRFSLVLDPGDLDRDVCGWYNTKDVVKIADTSLFQVPEAAAPEFMDWYMRLYRYPSSCCSYGSHRGKVLEKLISVVLLLGGVKELFHGASGWCQQPMSVSGFSMPESSVHTKSYCKITGINGRSEPLLWNILHNLGCRFSGGAGSDPGREYAQASWLKDIDSARYDTKIPDPMLLVAYFNDMKRYYDRNDLVLDRV